MSGEYNYVSQLTIQSNRESLAWSFYSLGELGEAGVALGVVRKRLKGLSQQEYATNRVRDDYIKTFQFLAGFFDSPYTVRLNAHILRCISSVSSAGCVCSK